MCTPRGPALSSSFHRALHGPQPEARTQTCRTTSPVPTIREFASQCRVRARVSLELGPRASASAVAESSEYTQRASALRGNGRNVLALSRPPRDEEQPAPPPPLGFLQDGDCATCVPCAALSAGFSSPEHGGRSIVRSRCFSHEPECARGKLLTGSRRVRECCSSNETSDSEKVREKERVPW